MQKIAVCVSGGGTNLQAIIDGVQNGIIRDTQIALVVSNKPEAYALKRAEKAGIPSRCISPKDYADREAFGQAMVDTFKEHQIDLVVFAGYLVIIPEILRKLPNQSDAL